MTLNDALILSYVKRGIGYGYSILSHVRESRSDEWVEFSRAGLYKTLDKLEKLGYIDKTLEQSGSRPAKKIYSITAGGEKAFNDFLENDFDVNYLERSDLDTYLITTVSVSPDASRLARTIGKRLDFIAGQIKALDTEWPENKDDYPFIVYALFKRRFESLKKEYDWLKWIESILVNLEGDVLNQTYGMIKQLSGQK